MGRPAPRGVALLPPPPMSDAFPPRLSGPSSSCWQNVWSLLSLSVRMMSVPADGLPDAPGSPRIDDRRLGNARAYGMGIPIEKQLGEIFA